MRKTISEILLFLMMFGSILLSQNKNANNEKAMASIKKNTNIERLSEMSINFNREYLKNKKEVDKWLKKAKMENYVHLKDGTVLWVEKIKNGRPVFYSTRNTIAAVTTSTNKVQPDGTSGLNLYGNYLGGMDIGIWDGGIPNQQHNAFVDQYNNHHLVIADTSSNLTIQDHATHVAGTLIGDASNSSARGMAWGALLRAWDSKNDLSEISYATMNADTYTPYLTISNHSYGPILGWAKGLRNDSNNWYWTSDEIFYEDLTFGNYDSTAKNLDEIALNAPNYLMVRAVGNERGEGPVASQDNYYYWDKNSSTWISTLYTGSEHPLDGGDDGYGCLPKDAVAKNILTVGAVDDIQNGYSDTSDVRQVNTKFSSWGPTTDGRIKPDIVANGDSVYSAIGSSYGYMSGTSQASPNACGSILLLQEYYLKTHNNNYPLASTLKALVINSANSAGVSNGPDYKYGWGLLNTNGAADIITDDVAEGINIQELSISNGQPVQFEVYSDGTKPICATIVWNDPIPTSGAVLVHDLDLRITDNNNITFNPFVLNSSYPNNVAATGDDTKNNVEKIIINTPTYGKYTVKISSKGSYLQNFSIVISNVTAQPQNMRLTVKQYFEDKTTETDSIARYESSNFVNYPSGHVFNDVNSQTPITLKATLKTLSDNQAVLEKFHDWNENQVYINFNDFSLNQATTTIKSILNKTNGAFVINSLESTNSYGGSVQFKDPWLRDDNSNSKGIRNRGSNPIWHSSSNFDLSTSSAYQGVFLGQGYEGGVWNPPYYSVKTTSPQTINVQGKNRNFYFLKWESSGATFQNSNNLETPVVFNQAGATVKAVMKGVGLSSNNLAFDQNNQRKIVRTDNGNLHMVYESMGKIWYEMSTDGGVNWAIMNNGQPISSEEAKLPSITYSDNMVMIVYQESYSSGYKIKLQYFYGGSFVSSKDVFTGLWPYNYSSDAYPVVTLKLYSINTIYVVWKSESTYQGDPNAGLNYWYGTQDYDNSIIEISTGKVPNTNNNSTKPSIVRDDTNNFASHLVWQQNGSWAATEIKYIKMLWNSGQLNFSNYSEVSNDGWYTTDTDPSITCINGTPTVVWESQDEIEYPLIPRVRTKSSGSWGTITNLNEYEAHSDLSVNINRNTQNGYLVAYKGGSDAMRYKTSSGTHSAVNPTSNAKYLQVCNGSSFSDMRIETFTVNSSPYYFGTRTISSVLSKDSDSKESINGREIIATKGSTKLKLKFRTPLVDNNRIEFISLDDTLSANKEDKNASYLTTEAFNLNDKSEFNFNLKYILAQDEKSTKLENIQIDVLLVDALTNKKIGVLESINTTTLKNKEINEFSYGVETKGIGNRNVKLMIEIDNKKVDDLVVLKSSYFESDNLPKQGQKNVTFDETLSITDYALEQNYPNPFNPSTIIKYQIPNDGLVTMKIYDITGQEVKTLVNESQAKGRYEINFDASNLSTGVYFYRLTSGSFTKSMKMILIK